MKKTYEAPSIEMVKFQYRDQVVVASACADRYVNIGQPGENECTSGDEHLERLS